MKNERKEEIKDEMKNRISLALKDPILQQGFEIICKENAELKDDNKVMADNYSKMEQKFYDNLTKAKELLRQWLQTSKASGCDNINIVTDTEQFLSEVEK